MCARKSNHTYIYIHIYIYSTYVLNIYPLDRVIFSPYRYQPTFLYFIFLATTSLFFLVYLIVTVHFTSLLHFSVDALDDEGNCQKKKKEAQKSENYRREGGREKESDCCVRASDR